jgi:hypothetical protein
MGSPRRACCTALAACGFAMPGCWSSSTATSSTTPEPPARAEAPSPVHPRHHRRAPVAPSPFDDLQVRLRTSGPAELPTYVLGPVVALGARHPNVDVSCGDAALDDAHEWGRMLADPAYPAAICYAPTPGTRFVCSQSRSGHVLILVFDDPVSPRLLGGADTATANSPEVMRFRALLDSATCP